MLFEIIVRKYHIICPLGCKWIGSPSRYKSLSCLNILTITFICEVLSIKLYENFIFPVEHWYILS